jgi:hypothetical protein
MSDKFYITFDKLTFSIMVNEELILFSLLIILSVILKTLLETQSTFMPNEKRYVAIAVILA